jgi:hypothetical protein
VTTTRRWLTQVELGIRFYVLALESFALGSARMCGAKFFC